MIMKKIMMSSVLAATACFAMIGQASAAPASHFSKHHVTHSQQHKAPQKFVVKKAGHKKKKVKNHKFAPKKVVYVKNHR